MPAFTRTALSDFAVNMHNSQAKAPTFSPAPGTSVAPGSNVTITSPQGYELYFTTDGSTPSFSNGQTASGSAIVTLTPGMVINAFAWSQETSANNLTNHSQADYANSVPSVVATAKYNTITAKAPVIEPTAGTFSMAALPTVTIVDPWLTTGQTASIYYTTNGQTPSATNGTLYSGPFTLTTAGQVKAVAVVGGATSPVASSSYIYNVNQPAFSTANGGQYPTKYTASSVNVWFTDGDTNATICVSTSAVTPVAGSCGAGTAQGSSPLVLSGSGTPANPTIITVYAYAYDGTAVSKVVSGTYLLY
jgi:hypothetical protein